MASGNTDQVILKEQNVGLLYGGAPANIDGYMAKLLNKEYEEETNNKVYCSQAITSYHAEYSLFSLSENSIGKATTGLGDQDNNILLFLTNDQDRFYNSFGTAETDHNNIYVKIVDLKTGHYILDLWADWYAKKV